MKNPFRFFNRKSRQPIIKESQTFFSRTASAVPVTAETARKSSAVYAGIRYLGQTLGQLPCCAYQVLPSGGKQKLQRGRYEPVNAMMRDMANPRINLMWHKLLELVVEHCILWGNFVAEIERNGSGRAVALHPLDPERLTFSSENGEDLLYEYYDPRGGKIVFKTDEVFHISNFGARKDLPSVGVSTIEYAAESIGWHQATELFGAAYFANGIHPSVVITLKNALTPEGLKVFKEQINAKFKGSRGSHEPFVTDGEAKVEQLSIQPDNAQFIQTLQYQIDEIARWIGVPPSKIGHLIHSGVRANVEHASIEVIRDAVMPWVRRIETEATAKFFQPTETHVVRMDLTALMDGDSEARSEYYRTLRNLGVLTANDILEREGMNPIGSEGDLRIVQGQYIPLEQIGREPTASSREDLNGQDTTGGDFINTIPVDDDHDDVAEEVRVEDDAAGLRRTLHL